MFILNKTAPFLYCLLSLPYTMISSNPTSPPPLAEQPQPLRVMSFNIRYHNPNDGYNAWPHRKKLVQSIIRFHQADLIGVQEALHDQMLDLTDLLPDHDFVGVGRDDGLTAGEYSAIWFRRSRFQVLESDTFWLSESPDRPGAGWDASLPRIVTWAKLRDLYTDQIFFHYNTHFDHRGEVARQKSAKLIRAQVGQMNPQRLPVLLTGDFNARPTSKPYQILTQSDEPTAMKDARFVSLQPPHGPEGTVSKFQFPGIPESRIDYIFIKHDVSVLRYATLSDSWAGRFPSDHLPIMAEVIIGSPP